MRLDRAGAALLEVLLALTILGIAGASTIQMMTSALAGETRLAQREREMAQADRVLKAMTLLSRTELDLRLGSRPIGEFVVEVQRPEPTLYRIALSPEDAPEAELLATVVHRTREGAP